MNLNRRSHVFSTGCPISCSCIRAECVSLEAIEHAGQHYRLIFGSDVRDGSDGVFLELRHPNNGIMLGAYWSDLDGSFTFFAAQAQLPFEVVEKFMQEARRRLPPDGERHLTWFDPENQ